MYMLGLVQGFGWGLQRPFGPYGKRRDTRLQRTDLLAFIERIVETAITPPSTAMFTFPSALTRRRSLAASSDISGAGLTPESIGTAPSGAWRVSCSPLAMLARPVAAAVASRASLVRTRVLASLSSARLPEMAERPVSQVAIAVPTEAALTAL